MSNKKELSERDIRSKFINPAIRKAGRDFRKRVREEVGKYIDAFDLICHVALDQPALTRKERVNKVYKRNYFVKYRELALKVINSLFDKYESGGFVSIETRLVLKVLPLNQLDGLVELVRAFGKRKDFNQVIKELEKELYSIA